MKRKLLVPKVGMQPVRRQQLIDATILTIAKVGYGDTTVGRIAKEAGLSTGIISHYFGSKQALLEATMARVLFELHDAFLKRLATAATHRERLSALVATNFEADQYQPEVVRAWLAFWAQVPFSLELKRMQYIYGRRLTANIMHDLKFLVPEPFVADGAQFLASLIDGFWLRTATSAAPPPLGEIRNIIEAHIDIFISAANLKSME